MECCAIDTKGLEKDIYLWYIMSIALEADEKTL